MIVIISDNSRGNWGATLAEAVSRTTGIDVVHFAANTLNIMPCTACSSCSGKTYGRCVIQDDMQQVLPKIAGCRTLVLVSPVTFGGVSHHIKKVMDRMSTLGDPRYRMSGGEMVKGMSGQDMNYYTVGIGNGISEAEQSAFKFLCKENRHIMNVNGRTFILDNEATKASIDKIAQEIAHG
ncbi:MAG: flavodoxin family protein [Saccharofermentanales bacterium]|jgi:multimeric flavodoxin WrbA